MSAIKGHQILPLPNLKQYYFFITNNCNVAIDDYVGTNHFIVVHGIAHCNALQCIIYCTMYHIHFNFFICVYIDFSHGNLRETSDTVEIMIK